MAAVQELSDGPACGNVTGRLPVSISYHLLFGSIGRRRLAWVPDRRGGHPEPHRPRTEVLMSTTVETATEIRPFQAEILGGPDRRPAPAHRVDALAEQGARPRSDAGHPAGAAAGAGALLGRGLRLRPARGAAERAAAVHHRDRRARDPLHPRALEARGRAAADHHARLARLGDRDARRDRATHRPDRAWRRRGGRVRRRHPVHPRLRLLGRADRARLGFRPHRSGLGRADEPPRLHPLRRAGRRSRCRCHRRDGPPGTGWAARRPLQLPRRGSARSS